MSPQVHPLAAPKPGVYEKKLGSDQSQKLITDIRKWIFDNHEHHGSNQCEDCDDPYVNILELEKFLLGRSAHLKMADHDVCEACELRDPSGKDHKLGDFDFLPRCEEVWDGEPPEIAMAADHAAITGDFYSDLADGLLEAHLSGRLDGGKFVVHSLCIEEPNISPGEYTAVVPEETLTYDVVDFSEFYLNPIVVASMNYYTPPLGKVVAVRSGKLGGIIFGIKVM